MHPKYTMHNSIPESGDATTFEVVDFHPVRQHRGWFYALGAAFIVLGALAILLPFAASLVSTLVIGCLMMIGGIFQGVHAIQNRGWGGSVWAFVSAVLQVVVGALVIAFPVAGTLTLTLLLALFFVAQGIFKIVRALQHRRMPAWGWLLFDGVLSLGLGVLIGLGWPSTAVWALGLLVGIDLVMGGTSMLLIGFSAGSFASREPMAGA